MLIIAFKTMSHTHQSARSSAYNNTNKHTPTRCDET